MYFGTEFRRLIELPGLWVLEGPVVGRESQATLSGSDQGIGECLRNTW